MRILAITFALSLIGCVDELADDSDPNQEIPEDIDPSNDTDGSAPNPSDSCDSGNNRPGGITEVSRKKADGSCF